jgi:hypothetical protein
VSFEEYGHHANEAVLSTRGAFLYSSYDSSNRSDAAASPLQTADQCLPGIVSWSGGLHTLLFPSPCLKSFDNVVVGAQGPGFWSEITSHITTMISIELSLVIPVPRAQFLQYLLTSVLRTAEGDIISRSDYMYCNMDMSCWPITPDRTCFYWLRFGHDPSLLHTTWSAPCAVHGLKGSCGLGSMSEVWPRS